VKEPPSESALSAHPQGPVFIVDDDPALLGALRFFFQTHGYKVWAFNTAEAAEAAWAVQPPGCAIVDHRLPDESGIDLLSRLKERGVDTPALLITTAPSAALYRQANRLNVPVIEKPLLTDELFDAAKRLLASR